MGHRKVSAPKRGSLSFLPKGRSAKAVPRIKRWPKYSGEPKILGFPGYKAGMTHVIIVENRKHSPYYGNEISVPVTVLDTPPVRVISVRAYMNTPYGLKLMTEAIASDLHKDLKRRITLPKSDKTEEQIKAIREQLDKVSEIRVLIQTLPRLAGVPKKVPDLMEYKVGASSVEQAFEYAVEKLGKEIRVNEVISEGMLVDAIAVTKGKGWQGPVKRWGIRILQHKSRKTKRGVGSIGSWKPTRVRYTIPRAGQMGYHKRTEYNKYILKIGERGEEITPAGGFLNYGIVRGDYVIVKGSLPGATKRLVRLRYPIRPTNKFPEKVPQIVYISTSSKQGK